MDTQTISKEDIRRDVVTAVVYWAAEQQVDDFYERHEIEGQCANLYHKVVGREFSEFEMDLIGLIFELLEQLGFGKWVSERAYQDAVLDTLPTEYLEEHGIPFELAKEDDEDKQFTMFHLKKQITLSIDQILWHLRFRSYQYFLHNQLEWHKACITALELLDAAISDCKENNGTKKEYLKLKTKIVRECQSSQIKTHLVTVMTAMDESY